MYSVSILESYFGQTFHYFTLPIRILIMYAITRTKRFNNRLVAYFIHVSKFNIALMY